MTVPGPYRGPERNHFGGHWTFDDTALGFKTVVFCHIMFCEIIIKWSLKLKYI